MLTNTDKGNLEVQDELAKREQYVLAREQAAKDLESQLQDKAGALKYSEADLNTQSEMISRANVELLKRQRATSVAEAEVANRDRAIKEREIQADAGFVAKNREALDKLTTQHTELRTEVDRVQAELDSTRLRSIENLDAWFATERATRMASLDAELQADRTRHKNTLQSERDAQVAVLAEQQSQLENGQQAHAKTREELEAKEGALYRLQREVQLREEVAEGLRTGMKREIDEQARDKVAALEQRMDALRGDHQKALETVNSLQSQLNDREHLFARFDENPEEWLRRFDNLKKKCKTLEDELLARPSASDNEKLNALLEKDRILTVDLVRLSRENTQLSAEQHKWNVSEAVVAQHKQMREIAEKKYDVIVAEVGKYKEDINRLTKLHERPAERAARIGTIEMPVFTDIKRAPDTSALKEIDWLDGIITACEASNMRFPKRLIHAFHTSLKAAEMAPLAILSGVSGTGKSELPRLYSRFGGLEFLALPVQPNWDSPQSLFGFFNSIDNRFNATDVLRAMVQMQHPVKHESYKNGLSDRLLLILLDEMNLAHVEQYFSDLLSGLEKRRGDDKDSFLNIDLGAGEEPYRLSLGRNVLWVGTMNEDETTKTLSDKVIDRANLLHFPRPKTLQSRTDLTLAPEVPLLAKTIWDQWLVKKSPFTPEHLTPFRTGLEEINTRLEHVGRALGHRVWQSIEYYIANHPEVIDARKEGDIDALQRAMRLAYEDQLVLKVMPKLRGIETSGDSKRKCLDPIRSFIETPGLGLNLAEDFDIACKVGHGAFIWNSAKYLEKDE
ncbi:hypothetical protein [Rhodoferax antarcticus]|uniref:hypothetical protein n=1 Tax=Rhodoferax antarcticus TaxID=81479 RepID=UPI0022246AD4|nr:hypothetical protein [Rhodoferax antarcticus]MCW2311421.1 hypothetical protein [Rhodoferax antarcticus]